MKTDNRNEGEGLEGEGKNLREKIPDAMVRIKWGGEVKKKRQLGFEEKEGGEYEEGAVSTRRLRTPSGEQKELEVSSREGEKPNEMTNPRKGTECNKCESQGTKP